MLFNCLHYDLTFHFLWWSCVSLGNFVYESSSVCSFVSFCPFQIRCFGNRTVVRLLPRDEHYCTVASIWFEIWGVVDPGQQIFDFSGQIKEKFRFFQAISQKISIFPGNFFLQISIFPGKFLKNFDFSVKFLRNFDFIRQLKKYSIFQAKIAHLQLLLGKLFYFSSKVTTFILLPVHNKIKWYFTTHPRPPTTTSPKSGGRNPQPPGLTPLLL